MNRWYPLRFIASLIWIGFLMAISFMEAPLKFQAPSVTLSTGLEIGRLVFATLNKMEWVLLLLMALSFWLDSSDQRSRILLGCIFIILILQTFYLLPELDHQAEIIISGGLPESSNMHFSYVFLEVAKLGLLVSSSFHFIYKTNPLYMQDTQ